MKDIFNIENRKRFRELVEVDPSGCWLWKGNLLRGYGKFYIPELQQNISAHRYLWQMVNGPVPPGLELDHLCRTKRCVRPEHLEAVTHAVNMQRAADAGAWSGERNGQSKRSEQDILVIKFLNSYLFLPAKHIAKAMKIPPRSVYAVLSGESWKSVELPKDLGRS